MVAIRLATAMTGDEVIVKELGVVVDVFRALVRRSEVTANAFCVEIVGFEVVDDGLGVDEKVAVKVFGVADDEL